MENRSTIIYLDWNVISSLAAGENDLLLSKLQQTIANGVVFVPYSYAHVLEIANITDSPTNKKADIVKANLSFLSDLSNDFQIKVADDESCAYLEKRPIRELYLAAQFIKLFLELPFPQDEKPDLQEIQAHRLQYGLDPNILNNIPPDQINNRIDEVLTSDENRRKFPHNGVIGKTIKDMYEANASSANALISELGVVSGIGTNMVLVYTYLDALGYWPDSGKRMQHALSLSI